MHPLGLTLVFVLLLSSCNDNCRDSIDISNPVDITIVHTEEELFKSESPDEVLAFFRDHPDLALALWHNDQYPSDSVLAMLTYRQISVQAARDTLLSESLDAFSKASDFEPELEDLLGRLRAYFPETQIPEVKTAISFFYHDLVVSDSLIAISSEFFIGDNASYAPDRSIFPDYVMRRYNYDHLPSLIAFFLAGNQVNRGRQNTLLSEMIDYGKTLYFASRLVPCTKEELIMGYSGETLADVRANQEIIWAYLVENQLLYETNHQDKKKFIEERPVVYEIGEKCPGRIGQWVGWQIVEGYMENNEVSMQELLADNDHHGIFEASGYKPRNE